MSIAEPPTFTGDLIQTLLDGQQRLTVVERFAELHEREELPATARRFRDLIPLTAPGQHEQYAFEVDLDSCSGCKACVTACHSMNGLEPEETWRQVGLLVGGTNLLPVMQHVTAACHHCVEPACLTGCPVKAYEKDPVTGIVMHLDDQCIGCQYCIFKCPYDVPTYSRSKGIVRKCDMCRHRLADNEPPACVAACPNQAIRITVVDRRRVAEESEANQFLPGAADPDYTLPTTIYKTQRPLPRNVLPADHFSAKPEHAHWPLIAMLVLTQMSVGAFVVEQLMGRIQELPWIGQQFSGGLPTPRYAALILGLTGMAASVMHLGRPLYAFRAVLGLRTSWLSREIVAFGLFAFAAVAYTLASLWMPRLSESLGIATAATGLLAVLCSVMVYVDTHRPFWNFVDTNQKFMLTAAVLGLPVALLFALASAAISPELSVSRVMREFGRPMLMSVMVAAAAKLFCDARVLIHLRSRRLTPLKRSAILMTGELAMPTMLRFFFGAIGGLLLPLVLLSEHSLAAGAGFHPLFIGLAVGLIGLTLTIGELLERYLFFTAAVAPRMPGVG